MKKCLKGYQIVDLKELQGEKTIDVSHETPCNRWEDLTETSSGRETPLSRDYGKHVKQRMRRLAPGSALRGMSLLLGQ
jgi:hypothetical protein